jgi:uncharacterized protein (TIGR02246 family)
MLRSSVSRIRVSTAISLFCLLSLPTACQTQTPSTQAPSTPDTRAADEATLRKLDDEWSKAAGAKDVEKTISYYSDDAIVLPPNGPKLTGEEAFRSLWKSMIDAPGFGGGWNATKIEVARSGDLAYVTGNYELSANDAAGKRQTDKGKFLEVWKKQADGNWKCVVDMFSSDLPVPAPK